MSNSRAITLDVDQLETAMTQAVSQCSIEVIQNLPSMRRSIALATGLQTMRAALTDDVMARVFMPMQGCALGFRTDKDTAGGYPIPVVRECIIEAMVRGFEPVGNEMNIIAGRAYFTKEAFERKVSEFPGLADLETNPGVPHLKDGGALVPYHASWLLNGKPGALVCDVVKVDDQMVDRRIVVRVNAGMGADAILGKAKRKFFARLYERLGGVKGLDGEADPIDAVGETISENRPALAAKTDELVNKHRESAAARRGQQTLTAEPTTRMREPGED